ncbi:hypothetical protein HY493_04055 [Candidatus Woesearchaeota archaeon]|nr:hypothetical protein [Candidatus Woesearchaeota archaeon]
MEKCHKHNKEHVGGCMWCGKRLCEFCVARKEGLKLYCEICAQQLGPPRRTIPKAEPKPLPPPSLPAQVEVERRRMPRMDNDGYFDFTTVRQ